MTPPLQALIAWLVVLCGSASFAQTPPGYPPPGHYFIDSESTRTVTSGGSTTEVVVRVVGSTGDTTESQKHSLEGQQHTQTYKGTGPNNSCIKPYGSGGPPAALLPFACKPLARSADPRGSSLSDQCGNSKVDQGWRRIDARTWEHTLTFTAAAGSTTNSPQDAMKQLMEMASLSMTPVAGDAPVVRRWGACGSIAKRA